MDCRFYRKEHKEELHCELGDTFAIVAVKKDVRERNF